MGRKKVNARSARLDWKKKKRFISGEKSNKYTKEGKGKRFLNIWRKDRFFQAASV